MADSGIPALPSATTLAGSEELHVVQGGNSRKTTTGSFYIPGGTDVAVTDGGTGASDAAGARTNLGLVIGTNVQAYNAGLADIAGLAKTDGNIIVGNGTNWVAESGATARASLGVAIGTDVQAHNSQLDEISALTTTSYGRSFLTYADEDAFKAAVNLEIGTDVQAHSALLDDIAGLTLAAGDVFYYNGTNIVNLGIGAEGEVLKSTSGLPAWGAAAGGGDMLASTYDPQNIAADAFDVDNHTDGTTNKVFTATEKTKLAGIETGADVTDAANVAAAGAFMAAGTALTSANDLNSLGATFCSVDWTSVGGAPTNAPTGWNNGFVAQLAAPTSSGGSAQIGFQRPGGAVAVRVKHSSAWEGWQELATKTYVDDNAGIPEAADIAALEALAVDRDTADLKEVGREGTHDLRLISSLSTDQQAELAADTENGVYVTSTTDPTYAWVRRYNYRLNVRHFGAQGDGNGTAGNGTDDTNAFKAAIAVCDARGGGEIEVPTVGDNRVYRLTSKLVFDSDHITFRGLGSAATRLHIDHTGVGFEFGVTRFVSWLTMSGFDIRGNTDTSHLFDFNAGAVYGVFEDMYVQQRNTAAFNMRFIHDGDSTDGTAKQTIETTFQRLVLYTSASHASWNFYARSTTGSRFNSNVLHRLRVHGHDSASAQYAIALLADGSTGFQQNHITSIVGEQNRGGLIILQGAQNTVVDNVAIHDMTGSTNGHMITVATGAGGVESENVSVRNYLRTAGTLGTSPQKYDIFVDSNTKNMTLINVDTMDGAENPVLNLAGDVTILGINPNATIVGSPKRIRSALTGATAHDVADLANGASASFTVTVTGAAMGDFVTGISCGASTLGCTVSGTVTADNTVTVVVTNNTGANQNISNATWRVTVTPKSQFGL